MNEHPQPMTADERMLAERLSRLGPHGEPSPAIDARILAAAHAAASDGATAHRAPARWPIALGIAASLTLAIGVAWQLRPGQQDARYDEAANATAVQADSTAPAPSATAPAAQAAVDAPTEVRAPVATPRPESTPAPSPPAAGPRPPRVRLPAPASPAKAPAEVAPPVAPMAGALPAPAAAPAPPRASPAAQAAAVENQAQAAARNDAARAAGVAATSREDAFAEDAAAEDVPPATADSPAVREAWLQRIRELANAGRTEDARASMREFVHRYPSHPLPDDLRPLAQ